MPQKVEKPSLPKWQVSKGVLATLVNCENFPMGFATLVIRILHAEYHSSQTNEHYSISKSQAKPRRILKRLREITKDLK